MGEGGSQSLSHCQSFALTLSLLFFPLGKKLKFTIDNGKLHNVSLGQGQEVVAENALDMAAEKGHWVILQVRGGWVLTPLGVGAMLTGVGVGHGVRVHQWAGGSHTKLSAARVSQGAGTVNCSGGGVASSVMRRTLGFMPENP